MSRGSVAPGPWLLAAAAWFCIQLACRERPTEVRSPEPAAVPAGAAAGAASDPSLPAPAPAGVALPVAEAPKALPAPDYEQADLDPDNDVVVAPPEPLSDCPERLSRAGIEFRPASLPLVNVASARGERVACGAEQVVSYRGGPAHVRYNSPPLLTCRLALALSRFEQLASEQAQLHLGQGVVGFKHLGTYSCRKMVRFDFVSEHSYANAIDIREIALENGERVSVARDFGPLDAPPRSARARFLRSLAQRAYDERLFSNVLTPFWDALHRDHFHLDLARYRVDGTRAAPR